MLSLKEPCFVKFIYLKKFYSNFFSDEYSNLPSIKQKLFRSKEEFNLIKDDFRFKIYNKRLLYTFFSASFTLGVNILYDKITPYLTMRRILAQKIKPIFLIFSFLFSYKSISWFKINVSGIINYNSKFGIYFYFENLYRNNLWIINENIDQLMLHQYEDFVNSKIKNRDKLELFLFYQDLITHYMYMNIVKSYLYNLNGDAFLNEMDKYKYGHKHHNHDKSKNIFTSINKSFRQEFNKLFSSENEKLKQNLEIPTLTKENLVLNFDHYSLALLYHYDIMKKILFKEFKKEIKKNSS